jgi:protein phosphatase
MVLKKIGFLSDEDFKIKKMQIKIPELSLVILIGVSSSGKSTFAKKHFKPTEILSSDHCRALISDDENDQSITKEAFEILHFIAAKRLAAGKLTVIDATNVQTDARKSLLALARKYHFSSVAIIFNLPEALCHKRNQQRTDRHFGTYVIQQQYANLKQSLYHIKRERFKRITIIDAVEKINAVEIKRVPMSNNRKDERGPFDIIGDVHGCFDELIELLEQLGYFINGDLTHYTVNHPKGRKAIFVGDLVDRGPKNPQVLRLVMDMIAANTAFCVSGNHDVKLKRKLKGKNVKLTHGLADTVQQLESFPPEFHRKVLDFIEQLVSHYLFDNGKLVVAHAGMKEELQGRTSGKVREFALYGDTTGEMDEFGLPVRLNWAADYRGKATVVYGHTPVQKAEWLNNTLCIDTGCVFGGKLTALRYPENELVSVPAKYTYYKSIKPFIPEEALAPPLMSKKK